MLRQACPKRLTRGKRRAQNACPFACMLIPGNIMGTRHGHDEGHAYYIFDRASAGLLLDFIVDHAYLTVGGSIFRQVCGIPMGISPAMYMANCYLFCYEFEFFRDALAAYASAPFRQAKRAIKQALSGFRIQAALQLMQPFCLASMHLRWNGFSMCISRLMECMVCCPEARASLSYLAP